MKATKLAMPLLRRSRDALNPALRWSLGNVSRKAWPGTAMSFLGCGAPIMVGRGETVFVCGVFQESTVIDFSRTVGPSGRVVVVEANPSNAERLRRAVPLSNVDVVNRAVWSKDEELEFEFAATSEAQHYNRVHDPSLQPFPTHMVEAPETVKVLGERIGSTMDRLGISRIDHLNLTVNGAELAAFRGDQGAELAPRVSRVYAHVEFPDPGDAFLARLVELGFRTKTSGRLNSRNPKIDLHRVYAWHG